MSKRSWRYVEVTFREPGADTERWFAVLCIADSPRAALADATRVLLEKHPAARDVEEFLQRGITGDKADEVRAQMTAGTWTGWPLTPSSPSKYATIG